MGVVELDLVQVSESRESIVSMFIFISSNDIVDGSRAEEVLLLKSQLFTSISAVVRVKNTGDVFSLLSLGDGTVVVTGVELVEVKGVSWSRSPQSQVVGVVGVESWNWSIVGHSDDFLAALPLGSLSWAVLPLLRETKESDLVLHVLSLDFPWVSVVQPKIRNFDLVAIFDHLLENSIFIPDTVTPSWDLKGSKRVNKASGESSETTVSEGGIALLLIQLFEIVSHVHEGISEIAFKIGVNKGILESSSHQEFERKVVNPLAVVVVVELLSIVPRLDEPISDSVSSGLVSTEVVKVKSSSSKGVLNMVNNLSLDGLLVVSEVRLHELPHLFSALLGVVVFELSLLLRK